MIRSSIYAACPVIMAICLSSCLPDEEAQQEQIDQWDNEIKQAKTTIEQLKEENKKVVVVENWRERMEELKDQKAELESLLMENEGILEKLKEEREVYSIRLEEFRVTHPLN